MGHLEKEYDYIIGGAGLAGLTLAWQLLENKLLAEKKLLLIDASKKDTNDRTWCFWAKPDAWIDPLPVSKKWQVATTIGQTYHKRSDLTPYVYHKIEGIDYYNFILSKLKKASEITFIQETIISEDAEKQCVKTEHHQFFYKSYFFKGYFTANDLKVADYPNQQFIWQHFLGWKIQTEKSHFKPDEITYMDMRIPEVKGGLSFIYILPENSQEALVEYTLFSQELWEKEKYEQALSDYIQQQLGIDDFQKLSIEYNKIPMTNARFSQSHAQIIPIGTLAGTVKPSTGYSFVRNYQHIQQIVNSLKEGTENFELPRKRRFEFYDEVLMNVLHTNKSSGHTVFGNLYQKNSLPLLLKFLNEETNLMEELKIMNTVPKWPFIKAVWEEFST